MIGHTAQYMLFFLSLMGSLVLPIFGEGTQYLRRKTDSLPVCTPTSSDKYEYYSKVYVLLELDGSSENREFTQPYPQDIQSIESAFVDAYEYLTPCDRSYGSNRGVLSASVIDGIEVPTSANNPANKYNVGSATWLVEITMSCNSCGNDDGKWQLFLEGTSPTPLNGNNCVCDGPVQTNFVNKFRQLFATQKSGNPFSDISVLNASQIPNLLSSDGTYNTKFCSSEEYSTTYSYDGVCPGRSTESPTVAPTKRPTDSPTSFPTEEPTESPTTESPTEFPTDSPTAIPTDSPDTTTYSVYFANKCNNAVRVEVDGDSSYQQIQANSCVYYGDSQDSVTYKEEGAAEPDGDSSCKIIGSSNNDKCNLLGLDTELRDNACVITIDSCRDL